MPFYAPLRMSCSESVPPKKIIHPLSMSLRLPRRIVIESLQSKAIQQSRHHLPCVHVITYGLRQFRF